MGCRCRNGQRCRLHKVGHDPPRPPALLAAPSMLACIRRSAQSIIWTGSGTLDAMKFTAADLAATLAVSPEESYVRVVADWLAHGEVTPARPALTGRPV